MNAEHKSGDHLDRSKVTAYLIIGTLLPGLAMACLCLPLNLEESFSESDYVLVAQLVSAKVIDHTYSIGNFEVSDVLKGDPPEINSLKTARQTSSSCGVVYWVGASYILFLNADKKSSTVAPAVES